MENFTPQQWAAAWVARIMQPEIKPLLPLPRHTKLPWTVPNWDLESEDIVNCYGPLEDPTPHPFILSVGSLIFCAPFGAPQGCTLQSNMS